MKANGENFSQNMIASGKEGQQTLVGQQFLNLPRDFARLNVGGKALDDFTVFVDEELCL